MGFLPAANLIAVLDGMADLGLDMERLRREAGLTAPPGDPEDLVSIQTLETVWDRAHAQAPRAELAMEVGFRIPLGAFGAMDYLAASSDTVGQAFRNLAAHFSRMVPGRGLEVHQGPEAYRIVILCSETGALSELGDELTVAILVKHFRTHTTALPLRRVALRRQRPESVAAFVALLGAAVTFGHRSTELEFEPHTPQISLTSKNPLLHRTLQSMSTRLGLGGAAPPPLEMVLRARLREGLQDGIAEAPQMAKQLGMSERSLHRKLAEGGRSYQEIADDVRRSEAERLLLAPDLGMAQIAQALGFADQSAFSRAFKRWTNLTPREWRAQRVKL